MIILETNNFKGSLLDLLGKGEKEALGMAPPSEIANENGPASRLIWRETARDEETGKRFPLLLMARVFEKQVWAVGVWAEDYLFVLRKGESGKLFFSAVPRRKDFAANMVSWVVRVGGRFKETGVAP